EVGEALAANKVRARVAWNGMGWRDGAEAVRRFQRAVLDHKLRAEKSTLMVSALSNCVVVLDEAGNAKISKVKSRARIDAAAAAVLAVSEGERLEAVPPQRVAVWA